MKSIEIAIGFLFLLSGIIAVIISYHRHMKAIWTDIAEKDANRLAEQKVREMKRNMQIRVVQRLTIKDEMGCKHG